MIIGFTGTQKGMSAYQMEQVKFKIKQLNDSIGSSTLWGNRFTEAHHGDCIGADEQFHNICVELGIPVVIHPPENDSKRAFCQSGTILAPKDYIARNHDIVDAVEYMIATPFEFNEQLRSGTWATIRYAKKKKKSIITIFREEKLNDSI